MATVRGVVAVAVTVLVAAVVLLPAVAFPDGDDFPLSPYRMFAYDRGRTSVLDTVVGIGADGEAHRLSPPLVNGTREVVQAAAVVAAEVRAGRADRLCREVAARVAGRAADAVAGDGDGLVSVQVVTEAYDAVAWFGDDERPAQWRTVHASCPARPR